MTVVFSTEDDGYFSSTLRRSHLEPTFDTRRLDFHTSASTSRLSDFFSQASAASPGSPISSAPSSPRTTHHESACLLDSSTPVTNFSLASDCDEASTTLEDVVLQKFDDRGYFGRLGNQEPPSSLQSGESYASSPNGHGDDSAATSRPGSPDILDRAEDDIAVWAHPCRHIDYLSHNWREEDIWLSWKFIVSRRGNYNNAARLENASWRAWMKSKYKLNTVSAEALNWLKDHDVTWLYGPLQTGTSSLNHASTSSSSVGLSKSNSCVNKKPILKKRSMSEIMLQRSLSTSSLVSSLVKQAATVAQAQQKGDLKMMGRLPGIERANTDYIAFPFSSRELSHDGSGLFPSARWSGVVSPNGGRKHIQFNEQVSQCIAVEVKGEDDDDDEADTDRYWYDSDSGDGSIVMKRKQPKKMRVILKKAKSHKNAGERKTIAMLPSTTLKHHEDTPEPTELAMKHSINGGLRSQTLSPSLLSQETSHPSKTSGGIFFAGDEDDDEEDEDVDKDRHQTGRLSSLQYSEGDSRLRRSVSSASLSGKPTGTHRITSGMFMPLVEEEYGASNDGLIGRIISTISMARNIAYIIWNMGWRNCFFCGGTASC